MLSQKVMEIIASTRRLPLDTVTLDSTFEELQIDSLDTVEIVFQLEDAFKIRIDDADVHDIKSVRQAIEKLQSLLPADALSSAGAV